MNKRIKYLHWLLWASLLPAIASAGFTDSLTAYKTGKMSKSPKPLKYAPVSLNSGKIELMQKLPAGTLVTLIHHISGDVFHTKISRSAVKPATDFTDAYYYSSLEKQPGWKLSDNPWLDTQAMTAIIGQHASGITTVNPASKKDTVTARHMDAYIRKQQFSKSVLMSDNAGSNDSDYLSAILPKLYTITSGDKIHTLVFYPNKFGSNDGMGAKFLLLEGNTLVPLLGECASMPYFYKIGQQLYVRHIAGQCESGFIIVENYAIKGNQILAEWSTDAYAN